MVWCGVIRIWGLQPCACPSATDPAKHTSCITQTTLILASGRLLPGLLLLLLLPFLAGCGHRGHALQALEPTSYSKLFKGEESLIDLSLTAGSQLLPGPVLGPF